MKKIWIVVGAILLFRLGSLSYADAKSLKQPIIVASELNPDMQQFYVSYITNRTQPHALNFAEIGNVPLNFASETFEQFGMNGMEQVTGQIQMETPYYVLYSATSEQLSPELVEEIDGEMATVYFTDGSSQAIPFSIQRDLIQEENPLDMLTGASGPDGSEDGFRALESFTIQSLKVDERIELKMFRVDGKEIEVPVESPIQVDEGDAVQVQVSDGTALFFGELATIEMKIQVSGKSSEESAYLFFNLNEVPSEEWINQKVKEAKKE